MKRAYILMTRVPIADRTNTRLMEVLSGQEAAEIHRAFLKDLFSMAKDLEDIDVFVSYTPREGYHILKPLVPHSFSSLAQTGEDLGLRMGNAIEEVLSLGYDQVLLTGTDIPSIQKEDIYEAFEILDRRDIVISPTYDGGYYMIGMKTYHSFLFMGDYAWGEKSVFRATIDEIEARGLSYEEGHKNLDIDDKRDLLKLYKAILSSGSRRPEHTLKYIESLGRF